MNKNKRIINYIINLSFFLYFLILLSERLISVFLSLSNHINMFSDGFSGYVYLLLFISIIAWFIYLLLNCGDNIKSLFKIDDNLSFKHICIASGILLLSGMVHTEYTIPVIQFISYGILIFGILLKVILINKNSDNKISLWLSFIYLVCLSMAIPVMYRSYIELHTVFHIVEAFASFILVAIFTYLLVLLFDNEENNLFIPWPIEAAIVLDVPIIMMRWNEEINYFVLIFLSVSVILFIIGYIYNKRRQKK